MREANFRNVPQKTNRQVCTLGHGNRESSRYRLPLKFLGDRGGPTSPFLTPFLSSVHSWSQDSKRPLQLPRASRGLACGNSGVTP